MNLKRQFVVMFSICLGFGLVTSCKKKDEAETEEEELTEKPTLAISSAIFSSGGASSSLRGAVVVLLDRDTSLGYAASIDGNSKFTFDGVDITRTYTIVLLNKNRVIFSALNASQDSPKPYFKLTGSTLPYLVLRGPTLTFANSDGIEVVGEAAKDTAANGTADGIESLPSIGLAAMASQDIDGDGLLNVFDPDDDDDSAPDLYDPDWPGALTLPLEAPSAAPYGFSGPLQDVSASVVEAKASDNTVTRTIRFLARIPESKFLTSISIDGSATTFADAKISSLTEGGDTSLTTWDYNLFDDGSHGDGAANDGWYGAEVVLATDKQPRNHEVLLFKMSYKNYASAKALTHSRIAPITLPKVSLSPLTAGFSADPAKARTIEVSGQPFGIYLDYTWSVQVIDSEGVLVHESAAQTSDVTTYDIPSDVTEAGKVYKVQVSAGLKPRYLGYPDYLLKSPVIDWTL